MSPHKIATVHIKTFYLSIEDNARNKENNIITCCAGLSITADIYCQWLICLAGTTEEKWPRRVGQMLLEDYVHTLLKWLDLQILLFFQNPIFSILCPTVFNGISLKTKMLLNLACWLLQPSAADFFKFEIQEPPQHSS